MLIRLDPPYAVVSLRPQANIRLTLRETHVPGTPWSPSWGADLWLMGDGSLQIMDMGLRLTKVMREKLTTTYAPELRDIGAIGAAVARDFDASTAAAGLNLPFRHMVAFAHPQPGMTNTIELGGVGAGTCTFSLRPTGGCELRVPPRPAPLEGHPLAPITRVAQERWDANWTPAHAAALEALLGSAAEAGLTRLRAKLMALPADISF